MRIPRRLRGYAYQTFYRLPGRVRRRIVRLIMPKYLVGAVTIITDSEAGHVGRPGPSASSGVDPDRHGRQDMNDDAGGAEGSTGPGHSVPSRRPGAGHGTGPGRLLLLRQPPGRVWGLPAGLLKRHEPPAVGAARELFEESGVRLDPDELVPATPNAVVHARGWVDVVFHGSVPASRTTLEVDGGEVLEARWFPLDALPPLTADAAHLLGIYGIGPAVAADQSGGRATSERTGAADDGRA